MDPTPRKHHIGFADDLELTTGSRRDWPYFARWHYRSHRLGIVKFVTVLWHRERDVERIVGRISYPSAHGADRRAQVRRALGDLDDAHDADRNGTDRKSVLRTLPVGICIFTSPPISLAGRNRFFGHSGRWSRVKLQLLSKRIVMLSRVVLHPTYRGAGLAAAFVRASCRACEWPWVESLAQMGHVNPFFEKAGFTRVDTPPRRTTQRNRRAHGSIYGGGRGRISEETHRKSRYADPVYYVFDNRSSVEARE